MASNYTIKVFLKAKTPDLLVQMQLRNNITHSTKFDYDIIFAKGWWYAFFEADIEAYKWKETLSAISTK
ncbi:MAG: hypothetical protein OEL89_00660 [Candidatus Peregrinibacteria bacterium]|nr:hypothetical protein [Candidatus Peregrinibacteria bacterium]